MDSGGWVRMSDLWYHIDRWLTQRSERRRRSDVPPNMSRWSISMTTLAGNIKSRYQILWEAPRVAGNAPIPPPQRRGDVLLIRATQAHTIPWARLDRNPVWLSDKPAGIDCLTHGTICNAI